MPFPGGEIARRFHELTKHSYASLRDNPHFLDWRNQPLPFKVYRDVESLSLPPVGEAAGMGTLEALVPSAAPPRDADLGEGVLSRLLFHAAGITKRIRYGGGGEMLFRAAACTGALYHIDLYLVRAKGVFHYDPREHALDVLRRHDWRRRLVEASGENKYVASADTIVALTSTYWRNAWKYQSRAYRHAFWDGGTMLSHLLAMARRLDIPAHSVPLFVDSQVEELLGLDPREEGLVTLVALGNSASLAPAVPAPERLELTTEPLSPSPVSYPLILETHRGTSLETPSDVRALADPPSIGTPHVRKLTRRADSDEDEPLESVIRRRGSARRFARQPISRDVLTTLLDAATLDEMLGDFYVIANDVEGLEPGAYLHTDSGLVLLKAGDFRAVAGELDLGQDLAADAAANVYVLADLEPVFERYGDRGYRIAALEGGLLGGRLYLAAYSQRLGATGLTFFDDAVIEFFSPHAKGKSVMFLVAIGVGAKPLRIRS